MTEAKNIPIITNTIGVLTLMKKFYTTLCAAAFAALTVSAQDDVTMSVGYCADESADAIGLYEKDLNVAAVKFEGDFLTQYAGSTVKSLSIQLGASFGSAGSVFVTDELTAPIPSRFDDEQDIPDFDYVQCYKWVEIPLDKPFTIEPDAPFFAGIRILPYKQAPYYGTWQFAVDDNAEAAKHSYIYDKKTSKWDLTTKRSWEGLTAPSFLIRLVVSGDVLPTNDIAVSELSSIEYMRTSETTTATFTVTNFGANDVTAFDADLILDGTVASTTHFDLKEPLATKGEIACTLDGVAYTTEGTHTVAVLVKNPNGVSDTHPEDNRAECEISVIDRYFDHNVLVEAFTTMSCANCPGAHDEQDIAFEGLTNIVRVDHHSGFGTDALTTKADEAFTWFYNNSGNTYAPGIMFDRAMIDDFYDPQRSPGEEHSPVIGSGLAEHLIFIQGVLANRPAYVDVNIDSNYDPASRELSITVSGEAIAKLKGDNPTLNVWLTESGLSAADNPKLGQMTSSGKLDMSFVHNHTMRATLTDSWGQPLSLGIEPYSETFTTTLNAAWKPENMEIVAFIANYDKAHPDNCLVHNSACAPVVDEQTSLVTPSLTTQAPAVYDLMGRRINTAASAGNTSAASAGNTSTASAGTATLPGVVILRSADGVVRKALVR